MATPPASSPVDLTRPEPSGSASRLDELVDLPEAGAPRAAKSLGEAFAPCGGFLGECLDVTHPTLTGRVLVRWTDARGSRERWMPTLLHLPVRPDDRVLLMQPANFDEPVVVGVLDGFARRPGVPRAPAARIELQRDEAVLIAGTDGQPLIELFQTDAGPVVRLLQDDVNLEVPGVLRLRASQIELQADAGSVEIKASDEVNVRGEVVNLN